MSNPDILRKSYGETHDGRAVEEITLISATGSTAKLLNYGATLTHLVVPDRHGHVADVLLGFDNLRQLEFQSPYFGSTVGRFANRIGKGRFAVDDVNYAVICNDGLNHLHGGFRGYDKRIWGVETGFSGGPSVRFTLLDRDGEEGYPGNVEVSVLFTLKGNSLILQYLAKTDAPTPINLTNHAYFNLKDGGATPIYDHILQVNADYYLQTDSNQMVTGEMLPVKGGPADFTAPKLIGRDLDEIGGYDHCLVLRGQDGELTKAGEVVEPESGRRMEFFTTEPGVQLYTSNFLDGASIGKGGFPYKRHSAFCLETQHYPDSVNQPAFPTSVLRPGEVYRQITEYRFSTV